MKKTKIFKYYYFDEKHDDFANNGIESKGVPNDFIFNHTNIIYKIIKPIGYYVTLFFFILILKLYYRIRQKNRKVLRNRREKHKGYFIYGNHTGWFPDAVTGPAATLPRQCYTIVNSDAINIPTLNVLVPIWGGIPIPEDTTLFREFLKKIKNVYEKGSPIVIYPEAHIWPFYSKIRDFDGVSFNYPVKFNAACFTKTTIFKRKKNGKMKSYCVYDGPFYPDLSLPLSEAREKLRVQIRDQMIKRIEIEGSESSPYYQYFKVNSKEEVRTEILTLDKKM